MHIWDIFRTFVTYKERMEKDELLKRLLMNQRLQGMESKPIPAEDPYATMEKDQFVSIIQFLEKRGEESEKEKLALREMVAELMDTHKKDLQIQKSLMKTQERMAKAHDGMMSSIDQLTKEVADLTTENKSLRKQVDDLLSQISVGNKVRYPNDDRA